MQSQGFNEARAVYTVGEGAPAAGQFRRFGAFGPAYEVVRIVSASHAAIRVVHSREELDYALERLCNDPITETLP